MTAQRTELFIDVVTELLSRGRRVRFRAEGGSMHPAIRGGDAIVVEPVATSDIRAGEVVLYRTERRVIAHRVVQVETESGLAPIFTLRGDAPGGAHEHVESHQVLGRVSAVERKCWGARLRDLLGPSFRLRARAAVVTAVMAVAMLWAMPAWAVSKSWVGTTGGSWTTAANWSPAGAPAAGDDVTIPADQSGNITDVPTITLNSLVIGGTCDLESNPTGNTITVSSLFTVASGKSMVLGSATNGRLEFTLAATATGTIAGTVDINSGNLGNRSFTNNGNLTITATGLIKNSQGTSIFNNAAGATLKIGSTAGITTAPTAAGNIQTTTRTFNTAADYAYNGTANQNTGNGLPAGVTGTVTIDNPGNTVTLNSAESIGNGGALNLVAGTFAAGTNLTMASTSSITRSGGSMTGTVQGAGVYDVTYTGNSKTTGGELSGGGLRNVTVNLTAGQTLTLDQNRTPDGNLAVNSGTFDLSTFTINRSAAGGTFTLAAGTTLLVGGANNFPANYTDTLNAASTVNYDRPGNQTVSAQTYGNLILSGSGTKTTAGVTNVAGNLSITDGPTFSVTNALAVTGTTTVGGGTSGTLAISNTTGTKTFTGLVTVNAGGTWTEGVNEPITFQGGITNNGTFTANNGVHTFDTNSQALTGTFSIPSVTVTGVTLTNNNTLTVGTALAGTGNLTQAANATLNIGGTSGITTLTATASGNTVNYSGAAQTVHGNDYFNLTLSGSGAKTLQTGTTAVGGNLTLSGTATATTVVGLTITGNLAIGNGTTFTAAGFPLTVTGTTTVGGGASGNLTISSATGTKIFTGLVTVNTGATWNNSGNSPATFRGGITKSGTFTAGTGLHTFDTNAQVITGTTATSIPNVTVNGVTLTNNVTGGLTVGTLLTVTGAGGSFDQGCTFNLSVGRLVLQGSGNYINCNSASAGGTGTLTFTGAAPELSVAAGSTFDYVGTGTITFAGQGATTNVSNAGTIRINGGGRTGGSATCGDPTVSITVSNGTNNTWATGSGKFLLADVNLTRQVSSGGAPPLYGTVTKDANSTGWGATTTCTSAPTLVKVSSFTATPTGSGVRISLQTSRDVNNLGFNLYREVNGQRVKLNASLLAGTALMGGAGTSFTAGQSRRWLDSGGQVGAVYLLEEVDLNGLKTWYGPIAVASTNAKATAAVSGPAQQLQAASAPTAPAGAQDEELSTALTLSRVGRVGGAATAFASTTSLKTTTATKSEPTKQSLRRQYALAAGAAVRLGVKEEGWYRVTQPQLVAAGIRPNVNPRNLQLFVNGVEQPIYVEGGNDGKFGAQDSVYFYGAGIDTTWSDTQVYWLVAGSEDVARMDLRGAAGGPANAASFPATLAWKPRTLYFAALLNGDGNNFFGPVVTDVPASQALTVSRLNAAGGASKLEVKLQGGTAGAHVVSVSLNGTMLGNAFFNGQDSVVATFTVPSVNEGDNLLTLTAANQDDVSAVDEVRLTYPHAYTADGDTLRFTAPANRSTRIDGFTSPSITVIDITDPANPSLVRGQVGGSAPNYSVAVMPTGGGGTRTLLAVGSGQVKTPTIASNEPSSWNEAQTGYDMVIVGHSSLLSSAAPLKALRQSQGHRVAVIDVQDLYDEFSFGVKSPYALKAFLSAANTNWRVKPHFVLLLGNGTFDPRNYLGTTVPDLVPVKLVDTSYMETASDDWFVDFDDDGIPDMAIGRLPAESAAAADVMVGRTVAYDRAPNAPWTTRALLVSGRPQDPGDDFAKLSVAVQGALPPTIIATQLVQETDPNPAGNLVAGINAGQVLVNYVGHGSNEIWAGGLFDSTAALALANGSMTPLVLTMTCLNGYFQDVYTTALGKALLNATGGGAVAVWASSGLSEPEPQSTMNQAMVRALYGNPAMTIGQAAAAAKAGTTDMDVRRTWILLGDPSTLLQ